ncbi:STAS domain-containing protein [Streptomyces sp. NPDC046939]|uniref:STAS domain-containing protein n=1 Tax=Streptomyces sp. NPDC046939 TaxID=3155376 RepID=UPI0033DD83CF
MTYEHARTGPVRSEYTVGDMTVLELRGDLDIAVTPVITARLDALTAGPHPDLAVDLRAVTFMDCAALAVLCRARARTRERQGRLRLISDSARVRALLRHTGLANTFEVCGSLTDTPRPPDGGSRFAGAALAAPDDGRAPTAGPASATSQTRRRPRAGRRRAHGRATSNAGGRPGESD